LRAHSVIDEEVLGKFEVDTRYVRAYPVRKWDEAKAEDTVIDSWGTKWHKPKSSHYWDPISFPLANATLDDLKSYHYPNLWNKNYEKEMVKAAERLHKDTEFYIIGDSGTAGIFEQCWMIRANCWHRGGGRDEESR
jgi:hypothetical protein